MPFTYEFPVPTLPDGSSDRSVKLEKWLMREHGAIHKGSAVAIIVASGVRYEVRANGDGFLQERLVKKGKTVLLSRPLAIIAADGESIPYGKPYSVADRLTNTARHGKRYSLLSRSWRVVKRILKTPLYPNTSTKGMRQGMIARLIFYFVALVVGLYFEVPIIFWFMLAAVVCGVFIAVAIRRLRDREEQ